MDLQPACARSCISSAIISAGCALSDLNCSCKDSNQNIIGSIVAPCLLQSCPTTDIVNVGNAGKAACSAYSLTYMYTFGTVTTTTSPWPVSTPAMTGASAGGVTISSSPTSVLTSSTSSPTSAFTSSTSTPSSAPTSQGTWIGLGVGIGVVCLALFGILALLIFFCLRRRQARVRVESPYLETRDLITSSTNASWPALRVHELQTRANSYELPGISKACLVE